MEQSSTSVVPSFGYELIRDHVLSSILGKHEDDILYWAGKELARKFPLFSMSEASMFFNEAGWGELTLDKESKDEALYTLHLDSGSLKIEDRCFRLEAGFLAEQQQRNIGYLCECFEEKNVKQNSVVFKLKWDLKEPVEK